MNHFNKAQVGKENALMQLGTLSGNPIAAVAGLKTLEILRRPDSYATLHTMGERLMSDIASVLTNTGHAHQIVGHPSLFDVVFTAEPVVDYRSYQQADHDKNALFNKQLRRGGILKSPGKLYPCLALTSDDLEFTAQAVESAARYL